MIESDIEKIREYLEDIRSYLNDTSDRGVRGQWNTFQYVAKSEDSKNWAAGTKAGTAILNNLERRSDVLDTYINNTLRATDIFEEFINEQSRINNGNYDGGMQ